MAKKLVNQGWNASRTACAVALAVSSICATATEIAPSDAQKAKRKAELLQEIEALQNELQQLDQQPTPGSPVAQATARKSVTSPATTVLDPVRVSDRQDPITPRSGGQTVTTIDREEVKDTVGFSVREVLEGSPGVTARQGNGPRDVGISIRGSNARQGFAFRNLKGYDDGFPFTEPDGLSRTDILDPHAYQGVDVVRGPSSALYGNYATGGALNFRTRRGRDINGAETGTDFGSFGYQNYYLTLGGINDSGSLEYFLFGSHVRGDGFINHSGYNTTTQNFLVNYQLDARNRFSFKFVNNDLVSRVPSRLTLNEFRANPFSAGNVFISGIGTRSAEQANQNREDRRTIVGLRWERQINDNTLWSTRGQYSLRDINQTFGTIGDTTVPSFDFDTAVTHRSSLLGLPAKHHAGVFYNYAETEGVTVRNLADFTGSRGDLTAQTRGNHSNFGIRGREEVNLSQDLTAILGINIEHSNIEGDNRNETTNPSQPRTVRVNRQFVNVAPEAGLTWRANDQWWFHGRVGTGYGIPGIGQLTTTREGLPGNNTTLQPQENVGIDIGADWFPTDSLSIGLTGFYEFFKNEFISQLTPTGVSFTENAGKSEHRGIEAELDWRVTRQWRFKTVYSLNDQVYTRYDEIIPGGTTVNRSGNKIPGVEPHFLNARVSYDQASGALTGFGGFLEFNWVDDYFINNANTLQASGFNIFNLNLHYNRELRGHYIRGISAFFEVQNLFDDTYITSATVVPTLAAGASLSELSNQRAFFVGAPRSFFGGMRLKF